MEVQRRRFGASLARRVITMLIAAVLAMFMKEVGKMMGILSQLTLIEEVAVTFIALVISYILLWLAVGSSDLL